MWGAAWSLHEAGHPAAEDWVAARALAVLAGDSDRAAQEIAAEAGAAGLAGSQRNGAAARVRYLENKREFLRYGQALDAGWPIATPGALPASPGLAGGYAQVFLAAPYMILKRARINLVRMRSQGSSRRSSDQLTWAAMARAARPPAASPPP